MSKKSTTSKHVGDCSPSGVMKQAVQVYKMSNAKNPVKTGNIAIDSALGQIPLIKKWNTGFNIGKMGFMAQQTYKNTCKRKK